MNRQHLYTAVLVLVSVTLLCLIAAPAGATQLKYQPQNPSFGGPPLNGSYMLNKAKTQDPHDHLKEETSFREDQTAQEKLEDAFMRRLRYKLVDSTMNEMFDADDNLQPGTYQMGDNTIQIDDVGDELEIMVESPTGQTTITIPE